MGKLFIFSIGGSGSRVVRAFSMLLACGLPQFKKEDRVLPLLIDYDVLNGDTKRTFNCVRTYHELNRFGCPGLLDKNRINDGSFFSVPMQEMKELDKDLKQSEKKRTSKFTWEFGTKKDERFFKDWIGFDQLIEEKAKTQDLLRSLYDTGNDSDTELGIDMTVGFKGNPNIGSVVFTNLKNCTEFEDFVQSFTKADNINKGDKVILIGSLFGGTGSSGIPEIVKAIRNHKNLGEDVEIGVIMIMPYFTFSASEETGSIKSNLFKAKTRAALAYYDASGMNKKINSIYYIGDPEPTPMTYSVGGEDQKNNSHIVDLIAALSILHFVQTSSPTEKGKKFYKYRMHGDGNEFNVLSFYNTKNVERFLQPLITMAFAIKFFEDEIAKKTEVVTKRSFYTQLKLASYFNDGRVSKPQGVDQENVEDDVYLHATLYYFQEFCDQFKEWIEELKKSKRRQLDLFDLRKETPITSIVKGCRLVRKKKGFIGGTTEVDMVKPLDFSEQIQKYYAINYADANAKGNAPRLSGKEAGYVFLDCLRNGINNIILNNPEIAEKLNLR